MKRNEMWLVVVSVLVVLGLLVGGVGCAAPAPTPAPAPAPAKPEVIHWQGQTSYPSVETPDPERFPLSFWGCGRAGAFFADWIKEATGGRLVIDVAPPGAVVPVKDSLSAISKGTLDMCGLHYGAYHAGVMPETNIEIGLPFAWETASEEWDALYNWGLQKEFEEIYAEHNTWPLLFGGHGFYHVCARGLLTSPDDLKGMKIRATGIYGRYIKALGGIPVVLPKADLYMALKLGTVDGAITGASALSNVKLQEVTDCYVRYPNLNNIGCTFMFNMDSLNALPDDIRELIYRDSYAILANYFASVYDVENSWSLQTAVKEGYVKEIIWSEEDTAKVRKIGIGLWDEVAAKSPRCAKLIDIIKAQARDLGKIE